MVKYPAHLSFSKMRPSTCHGLQTRFPSEVYRYLQTNIWIGRLETARIRDGAECTGDSTRWAIGIYDGIVCGANAQLQAEACVAYLVMNYMYS